jgi:hypothetical protein
LVRNLQQKYLSGIAVKSEMPVLEELIEAIKQVEAQWEKQNDTTNNSNSNSNSDTTNNSNSNNTNSNLLKSRNQSGTQPNTSAKDAAFLSNLDFEKLQRLRKWQPRVIKPEKTEDLERFQQGLKTLYKDARELYEEQFK